MAEGTPQHASPSKLPTVNSEDGKQLRDKFQLLVYACRDESASRDELAAEALKTATWALATIGRLERQNRAANQRSRHLQERLLNAQHKLQASELDVTKLQATVALQFDDRRMATTTRTDVEEGADASADSEPTYGHLPD
ncbi:hypothetical protein ANANG_G00193920 [Anguilla anguilla]|uniref:Uncharacterized protein n=1 Tax=Anguilla anguilla TaxID=7936 RepID=A0A9D3M1L6_ANGAN|nr:hypothetical protein ANANG_G00193920 [Anguilla anguilla]